MKNRNVLCSKFLAGSVFCLILLLLAPPGRAAFTLELHIYRSGQGSYYSFYTPLLLEPITPPVPDGTYIVQSPGWPTNGSRRAFDVTAGTINDHSDLDGEHGYSDFASVLSQITNGAWTVVFTNLTVTNIYSFTVTNLGATSKSLSGMAITAPAEGAVLQSSDTNFTWTAPAGWAGGAIVQTYNQDDYYQYASLPAGQTNWNVDNSLPADVNYTFSVQYLVTNSLFSFSTPLSTNDAQPIGTWAGVTILESGSSVGFDVVSTHGLATIGHTCFANYTFEDNDLFVHDFSGNGNNLSYAWFQTPPTIVTNDAVAGMYAGGFGGSGWFTAPDTLTNLFSGSFSVSLWLKTTNNFGADDGDEYAAAGVISALSGDYSHAVMPVGITGGKLAFYTGGDRQNTLHSQTSVNTGHYVHVVTTRDQLTGEKRIYVNGVLDASLFSDTNLLDGASPGGLSIGYNNGNVFTGEMDEIQFYSGVLSSNDVAFLHAHPGTNVADTIELSAPAGRYDFEDPDSAGTDSSGHHHDADSYDGGSPADVASTDAAVGTYAREFFGSTWLAFTPGGSEFPALSNALSGSFTVTAWVKTTDSMNNDGDEAYFGLPVLFAYNYSSNSTVPLAITGSKAAFEVVDEDNQSVTLHSSTTVNDGAYHFLAATRDLASGQMNLYVDGSLQATGVSSKHPLQIPWIGLAGGDYALYAGLLDDVRIYAGVLSPDEVATLAAKGGLTFNSALGTAGLSWITSGDANWFVETTNTFNGGAAAQSGSITGSQSSLLSVTVTGPGKLDFEWASTANDPNQGFDYEFYIDDPGSGDVADLYGSQDWQSIQDYTGGLVSIPAGQHTLNWVVYADGDTDPTEAGFLAQVRFAPADTNAVSANITFNLYRSEDPVTGDVYFLYPSITSITPPAIDATTNYIASPSGEFSGEVYAAGGWSSSTLLNSLAQVLNECTNGLWTLYVNLGSPAERQFQFSVSLNNLTTNLLPAVTIISPTNGATGVPAGSAFVWGGPTNYSTLTVTKQKTDGSDNVSTALPATATTWPSPPLLDAGTNQFDVAYQSNNFPGISVSVPVDTTDMQTVAVWSAQMNLNVTARSIFTVVGSATPVQLVAAGQSGTSFQIQFPPQMGYTNAIQYCTNLVSGSWQTYTNVTGDGSPRMFQIPLAIFGGSPEGFIRVLTQ